MLPSVDQAHGEACLAAVPEDWCLPDELWEVMEIYIPKHANTHRFGGGRPRTPDRVCANAIFYVLRTGGQWNALEATKFCPGSTAHDCFQEWVEAGVFFEFCKQGLLDYDCLEGIDWSWLSMDGCMTKAPLGGERRAKTPPIERKKGSSAACWSKPAAFPSDWPWTGPTVPT